MPSIMKKLLMTAIAVPIIFFNFSCKKDLKLNVSTDAYTIAKVVDGRISFTSKASYESYFSAPDRKKVVNSIPGIRDFVSFYERKNSAISSRQIGNCNVPDSLVENNSAFFDLLDINGVLQIDNYLYRYDYCNDKMWVISAVNNLNSTNHNNFMNGVETNGIVGSFPNYVDVLEAVAAGFTTMPAPADTVGYGEIFRNILGPLYKEKCNINNDQKYPQGQNVKMDGLLEYDKFAVYFHFYGKEKYQEPCFFDWCTSTGGTRDWYVFYWYQCQRRGQSQWLTGQGNLYPPYSGENKTDKTFYEGNRGLNWGDAVWKVENMLTNKRLVERNYGSSWSLIASESYNSFKVCNNYTFSFPYASPQQFEMHF
jgi:hypothetical protein